MTNLDELEKVLKGFESATTYAEARQFQVMFHHAVEDAAPALIAELRAARAVCELITLWAGVEMTTLHPDIAEALDAWQKARDQ